MICICEDGHMFRITKGAEQKIRGLKWNNKRPDLIICDDLENDEIVLNKERRAKFKRWFYALCLAVLIVVLFGMWELFFITTLFWNLSCPVKGTNIR